VPRPSAEALALGAGQRLALLAEPRRGAAGERIARGVGASLEFQDRRPYQPGDDVRHVDWRALARTDQTLVLQHREEVLPRVEIVIDPSRSMAVEPAKAQLATDLAGLLSEAARTAGFQVALALAGERPELLESARLYEAGLEYEARSPWPAALEAALALLRQGSMRILISDFLFPHDAAALVRPLAARGRGLALIQVLGAEDVEPPGGAARLTDSESGALREQVVDAAVLRRYRERLARLCAGLEQECRRAGARHVRLVAPLPPAGAARALGLLGLLEPD
jgi:uncharacterized protein (DUF58 family)